jgi:predicted RND superfamily exporter protein
MGVLRKGLRRVAGIQHRHAFALFIVVLVFTGITGVGLTKLELETDFNKLMPQDLDIIQLNERIRDTFAGQDSMLVLVTLDVTSSGGNAIQDIRDPSVIEYLGLLETSLREESDIINVVSPATYLAGIRLASLEMSREVIGASPASAFISKDFKTALMFISADVGTSDPKVIALDKLLKEKVEEFSVPPGTKVLVTGEPQIRVTLFDLLGQDALNTILYASVIILILLFLIQRSFSRGFVIFAPLALGLVWAYGTIGWMGLKVNIATAGLGAIILGLGVEYGVFSLNRYLEERRSGKSQLASLRTSVPAIGAAVIGSGTTTMVGFLALTFSMMPMIQDFGFSLALGIFYSLLAAIFVQPIIIVLRERAMAAWNRHAHKKFSKEVEKYRRRGL